MLARWTAVLAATTAVVVGAQPAAAVDLAPPVTGQVVAVFEAPTRYGPGHRGVDLAARPGTAVRASAAGTVTFAGRVVDATWVTVDHGHVRTTIGHLATVLVRRGQRVERGAVVGTAARTHGRDVVHWSARIGDVYIDPLPSRGPRATLLPAPDGASSPAAARSVGRRRPVPVALRGTVR